MPVVSEPNRRMLQKMEREHVEKAMAFFDKEIREGFKDTRWRKWSLSHNGKLYPPKDLLRCAIAVMTDSSYDFDSVEGGGNSINKYFTKLGFVVVHSERPVERMSNVILSATTANISSARIFSGEIPSKEEIERALRSVGGEADEDTLKEAIEDFFEKEERKLRMDWWEIAKRNLIEWAKKG